MGLFGKKDGNLVPKQGTDKNGRQYTRLVRPDGDEGVNSRRGRIPAPQILAEIPEEERHTDYLETSTSVLNRIPAKDRANITPDQLDKVFNIMQEFGVADDDYTGFRRYVANKEGHKEWSERGFGSRFVHSFDAQGNVRDVRLYSISDYSEGDTYPVFYEAQAKLRAIFDIPEYNEAEVKYLAGRYWDSAILPARDYLSVDDVKKLRASYIKNIQENPNVIGKIVSELKESPRDVVSNLENYVSVTNNYSKDDTSAFVKSINDGKFGMAERELGKLLGFTKDQTRAIKSKIDVMKKEAAAEARKAKKAATT